MISEQVGAQSHWPKTCLDRVGLLQAPHLNEEPLAEDSCCRRENHPSVRMQPLAGLSCSFGCPPYTYIDVGTTDRWWVNKANKR